MKTKLESIKNKLTTLHKKECTLQYSIKKGLKEPSSSAKIQSRIFNESKLRELKKTIEQEEYKLSEARILSSLKTR